MTNFLPRWDRVLLLLFLPFLAQAQTGVGIGTTTPNGQFEVASPGAVAATDQQSTSGNSSTVTNSYWQSFTAGSSGQLSQLAVYGGAGNNSGAVAAPALLDVFVGTGTGGVMLASQSFVLAGYVGNTTPTTVSFSTPGAVVAGQVYTFRVSLVSPGPGVYGLASLCTNNCYAGGYMSISGGYDANFQTVVGTPGGVQSNLLVKNGNVGIGTSNPGQKLEVAGTVYSTSGGFKFPDGTTQASAAVAPVNQTLSVNGQNLTISGAGGNTVALPPSPGQTLSVNGQNLTISGAGGNTVALPTGTSQTLSLNGQNLTISGAGGNTIALPASISSASNGLSATAGNATLGGPLTANTDVPLNSKALTFSGSGSVGIGTATPAPSAALDVSSTTKGLLPPRMTQVERNTIASPAAGLTVYNTSTNKLNTWNGTTWTETLTTTEQSYQGPAVTFNYTGGPQTYTVPAGVHSLSVDAIGASGGTGLKYNGDVVGAGGNGARVRATLAVTPGETLTLYVGGAGTQPVTNGPAGGAGYNGGGNANSNGARGGGGGGASDVRRSTTAPSTALAERLLVAAGGGGGSGGNSNNCCYAGAGGAGGAPNGATGGTLYYLEPAGTGATQSAGGSLGGSLGQGGDGASGGYYGGAGGGGYYGGGGSSSLGAGGGGSSWVAPAGTSGVAMTAGYQAGNGYIVLTPGVAYAAPVLDGSNFVNVPGDNLGNHTATQNLNLGTSQLVGNGGSTGLAVNSSGSVGIGTVGPATTLDVRTADGSARITVGTTGATGGGIAFGNPSHGIQRGYPTLNADNNVGFYTTGGNLYLAANGAVTNQFVLTNGGNVGIGTATPGVALDVTSGNNTQVNIVSTSTDPNGVLNLTIPATNGACPTCSEFMIFGKAGTGGIGSITANLNTNSVTYNTTSDKRLKENIARTRFGLSDLMKIEVKDYNFIGTPAANRTTGFLAQDLFTIFPDAVKEGDHGTTVTNKWAVDYGRLTPLLVQAIQDQQKEIDALKAQLAAQAGDHAALQTVKAQAAADHADLQSMQQQLARLLGDAASAPATAQARK